MGENSNIEWCHHTFNPWRGCTKVSAGCKNCYAETLSNRNPKVLGVWGPKGSRPIAAEAYWNLAEKWDAAAEKAGERRRVFCSSLADVFEGPETMPEDAREEVHLARLRLWCFIEATPNLDWLLLTKRPENILRPDVGAGLFAGGCPPNVWLGTSVEDQKSADERIPHLLKAKVPIRFLSCEPLLGPVDLTGWMPAGRCRWQCQICQKFSNVDEDRFRHLTCPHCGEVDLLCGSHVGNHRPYGQPLSWVIVGGESGPNARPMHPNWARSLRDQAQAAHVPFLFKQWGEYHPRLRNGVWPDGRGEGFKTCDHLPNRWQALNPNEDGTTAPFSANMIRVGKKAAGRVLDGRTWDEFPGVAK